MKITQKQAVSFSIILSLFFAINSCSKDEEDPCQGEYLGEFNLMESSRDSIPYNNDLRIFFKDSTGNEVVFEVKMDSIGYESVLHSIQFPCEFDNSRETINSANGEAYRYYIIEPLQTLGIHFNLRVSTAFAANDRKSMFDNLSLHILGMPDPYTYISIIVNARELTDDQIALYLEPIEEVTLLNKTFKNVYSNSSSRIFYNYDIGLIGFRDKTDNLWVFEKTEEIE